MLIKIIQIFSAMVLLLLVQEAFLSLDGYFWPVYDDVTIISSRPVGANQTELIYSFRLARDCQFGSTNWFIGTPNNSLRVNHVVDTSVYPNKWLQKDEVGTFQILINMSYDNFLHNSYALAVHECYLHFMGETRTYYYMADKIGSKHDPAESD